MKADVFFGVLGALIIHDLLLVYVVKTIVIPWLDSDRG